MKKFKNQEIKPLYFLIFLFLIFVIVGLTYAYLSTQGNFANKFKTSAYDIELSEEFNNDWGTKKVNILNKDTTPVVLRVNFNELWLERTYDTGIIINENQTIENQAIINSNSGNCRIRLFGDEANKTTLSNIINGEEVVTKNWTMTWNDFIKGKDGWYYYNKILDSNSSIQILESISLRNDLISSSNCYEDYNNYEYELSFNYEAIQANINAIKDIWGYNVTLNGGDIIWDF